MKFLFIFTLADDALALYCCGTWNPKCYMRVRVGEREIEIFMYSWNVKSIKLLAWIEKAHQTLFLRDARRGVYASSSWDPHLKSTFILHFMEGFFFHTMPILFLQFLLMKFKWTEKINILWFFTPWNWVEMGSEKWFLFSIYLVSVKDEKKTNINLIHVKIPRKIFHFGN